MERRLVRNAVSATRTANELTALPLPCPEHVPQGGIMRSVSALAAATAAALCLGVSAPPAYAQNWSADSVMLVRDVVTFATPPGLAVTTETKSADEAGITAATDVSGPGQAVTAKSVRVYDRRYMTAVALPLPYLGVLALGANTDGNPAQHVTTSARATASSASTTPPGAVSARRTIQNGQIVDSAPDASGAFAFVVRASGTRISAQLEVVSKSFTTAGAPVAALTRGGYAGAVAVWSTP
jgi:hypothetical protein